MIVVKIGGSLMENGHEIIDHLCDYTSRSRKSIVVVPGGGVFADVVRRCLVSDDTAHWMAILAMNQYGLYLSDGSRSNRIGGIDEIGEGVSILLPYSFLWEKDELAHTWEVTSDTIAAYIAKELNARLIKATDVDGVYIDDHLVREILAEDAEKSCIDPMLPKYLQMEKLDCIIVNGKFPDRIIRAIEGKDVISTRIIGSI
jgi:hypothetical protein